MGMQERYLKRMEQKSKNANKYKKMVISCGAWNVKKATLRMPYAEGN